MLADIAGYLQIDPASALPEAPLWAALALVCGGLLGEFVRRALGLPRIVGYSAAGLLVGLGLGRELALLQGTARLVVDLALALLLFELGGRVRLAWLRANPALWLTGLAESALSFAAIGLAVHAMGQPASVALTCAALGSCASGAVVARVAGELKAAGQVTERMFVLATINTLFAVLAVKLVVGWLHLETAGDWVRAIAQPMWAFGGSALLALALAGVVAAIARRLDVRDENAALLLLGLVVLALMAARGLNLSTLLVPLLAGVLLRNMTDRPWVWPRHFGTAGGVLVLMMFVVVGGAWSVPAVAAGGALALVLLAVRALAKGAAVVALAPASGLRWRQGAALALTLTPLSGTALVLLADLHASHPLFAPQVTPVILSAIVFTEVLGPLAVQWGLKLAGEDHPEPRPAQTQAVAA